MGIDGEECSYLYDINGGSLEDQLFRFANASANKNQQGLLDDAKDELFLQLEVQVTLPECERFNCNTDQLGVGYIYKGNDGYESDNSLNYSQDSITYKSQADNSEIQIQSACRNVRLKKKKAKVLHGKVDIDIDNMIK